MILSQLAGHLRRKQDNPRQYSAWGAPEILARNGPSWRDRSLVERNFSRFRDALLTEVIPQVEKRYRAAKDRSSRAIAGLSMGGSDEESQATPALQCAGCR